MKKKEIIIVTTERSKKSTKDFLRRIWNSNPELLFSAPVEGRIGNMVLLTVKAEIDSYESIIEKIRKRGLKVYVKEVGTKADSPEEMSINSNFVVHDNLKIVNNMKDYNKKLDEFVKRSDYKGIINIAKDPNVSRTTATKAENLILPVVEKLIDDLNTQATKKSFFAAEGIDKLFLIANDKKLELHGYVSCRKIAALNAIKLCGIYEGNSVKLIDISNSITVPKEICLKAAALFGKITLADKKKFSYELIQAEKKINYRWLETIYDGVSNLLSDDEIRHYHKIKKYIEELKSK